MWKAMGRKTVNTIAQTVIPCWKWFNAEPIVTCVGDW